MVNNYKVAYNKEWEKLKTLDLIDIKNRLKIDYDEQKKEIKLKYFNKNYILNFEDESILDENSNKLSTGDSIIVLNYLTHSKEYVEDDYKWVSLKEISSATALFYPAFNKSTIQKLIKTFDNKTDVLTQKSINLGGEEIKMGDVAYKFQVLPKISIGIVFWQGDDEIESNATVLFNPSIKDLVHVETVIGIGSAVVEKMVYSL